MQPLNIIGSFQGGLQNALAGGQAVQQMNAQQEEMKRQGEMRNWLTPENASALVRGDQNALATFAQMSGDPMAAVNIGLKTRAEDRAEAQHGQSMELGEARMTQLREQGRREAETHVARMSAAEREREAAETEAALKSFAMAHKQGPEAFEAAKQQNAAMFEQFGVDPAAVTYENFPDLAAVAVGGVDALRGPAPQSPEGKLQADIDAGLVSPDAVRSSEAEQEIGRLLEIPGVTRETAIKIKEGVYRVYTDPVDRTTYIIDLATQQPVQIIGADGAPSGGGQPSPQQPGQTGQVVPNTSAQQSQPTQQQGAGRLSFGQDVPTGGEQAFGLGGVARNLANTASDAVGMGEVFPSAAEHQRFFKLMEEDLLVDLSQAYGRQPAMQLMERIRSLLPQAGTLEGAERARGELEQLKRRFSRDLASAQSQMSAPGRMRPEDRDAMRERAAGLRSTLDTIDEAIMRLGGGSQDSGSGEVPSSFADAIGEADGMTAQEIWDAMPPEDRQLWQN